SQAADREIAQWHAANSHSAGGNELEQQMRRSIALSNLPLLTGRIELPKARASIDVPTHFRFVERSALESVFSQFGDSLDPATVGWMVHESVNLTDTDAWYIEIDWHADGYVTEGNFVTLPSAALLNETQSITQRLLKQQGDDEGSFRIVRYAETPDMNVDQHTTTWVEETASADQSEHRLDCYAAKLARGGA